MAPARARRRRTLSRAVLLGCVLGAGGRVGLALGADATPGPNATRRGRARSRDFGGCPAAEQEPWRAWRLGLERVLGCAVSPSCVLRQPASSLLLAEADGIVYGGLEELAARAEACPLGFAAASAVVHLSNELEGRGDAVFAEGILRLVLAQTLPRVREASTAFGLARPLRTARDLARLGRRRLMLTLNLPALSGEVAISAAARHVLVFGNRSDALAALPWPSNLHVVIHHRSSLPLLRNAIESLASSGVFASAGISLELRVSACGGKWSDSSAPEGWYLHWLRTRLRLEVSCGDGPEVVREPSEALVLRMDSAWHLLAFHPGVVASRLRSAADLLRSSPEVVAVSLGEKSMQGLAGLAGSGSRAARALVRGALRGEDFAALSRAAPAFAEAWDLEAAAGLLARISRLDADMPELETSLASPAEPCARDQRSLCTPAEWWAESWAAGDDVWLSRGELRTVGPSSVAVSHGLFAAATGPEFDATPSAKGLGVPGCFACHEVPVEEEFTLYLAPLDVIGPCRELFSNLLMDALESLQLASFQGPHAVLVEPLIPNAVWRKFTEADAESLKDAGLVNSIYSYWRPSTSCGLRHGSATRFGDLFDWPALVEWLRDVRGISGGITFREFAKRTGNTLDALVMLSEHPEHPSSPGERLPCASHDEPLVLRFFDTEFGVQRRRCVRSRSSEHAGGFDLRFYDLPELAATLREAVSRAKAQGRRWASVGLYLYWVEGPERARLHPGRYGLLSAHHMYTSIWSGLRYAAAVRQRAAGLVARLGLQGRFLAAHWRQGDWFLGPHPRKMAQARLAEAPRFSAMLRMHLERLGLSRVFLMTNAPFQGPAVRAVASALPGVALLQAPVLRGDRHHLRQLCVEMAIATSAEFFVAFGDGVISGMSSMPSLLVLQMRLHAVGLPWESAAFSFAQPSHQDDLGL